MNNLQIIELISKKTLSKQVNKIILLPICFFKKNKHIIFDTQILKNTLQNFFNTDTLISDYIVTDLDFLLNISDSDINTLFLEHNFSTPNSEYDLFFIPIKSNISLSDFEKITKQSQIKLINEIHNILTPYFQDTFIIPPDYFYSSINNGLSLYHCVDAIYYLKHFIELQKHNNLKAFVILNKDLEQTFVSRISIVNESNIISAYSLVDYDIYNYNQLLNMSTNILNILGFSEFELINDSDIPFKNEFNEILYFNSKSLQSFII